MALNYQDNAKEEPLPGWVCVAIGVGFLVFLAGAIVGVRALAGA